MKDNSDDIIIPNFFKFNDHALRRESLHWIKPFMEDARSDDPETIFRFFLEEMGMNLLFFWIEDENFYYIDLEEYPYILERIPVNPEWDGHYMMGKQDYLWGNMASEVLCSFEHVHDIWDKARIDGKTLAEILPNCWIQPK